MLDMFVFFNDTATTEIYTLSLHDALPISEHRVVLGRQTHDEVVCVGGSGCLHDVVGRGLEAAVTDVLLDGPREQQRLRSEEHTSELQSRQYLVCRLLLEKKQSTPASHTFR